MATRVRAVPEVINDHETGLLIDVQDTAGMARVLIELVDNEFLRVKVESGARTAAGMRFSFVVLLVLSVLQAGQSLLEPIQ